MCNFNKEYNEKLKNLNHVKILAVSASGLTGIAKGIYKDGDLYRFENVGIRQYVCVTQLIDGVWQV